MREDGRRVHRSPGQLLAEWVASQSVWASDRGSSDTAGRPSEWRWRNALDAGHHGAVRALPGHGAQGEGGAHSIGPRIGQARMVEPGPIPHFEPAQPLSIAPRSAGSIPSIRSDWCRAELICPTAKGEDVVTVGLVVRLGVKPGKDAHLAGRVAAALVEQASELLAEPPASGQAPG